MVGSINKAVLLGNLGKDPEVRHSQDGNKIVSFPLATTESWKSKTGERQDKTEWHRVVIFAQGLCDVAEKYLSKGSKVYIEGQIRTRKWQDSSGQDKFTTEVILSNFNSVLILCDRNVADNSASGSDWDSSSKDGADISDASIDIDDELPPF